MKPTKASNRDIAVTKTVKISEFAIVYGMLNSPCFKNILTQKWAKAFGLSCYYWFRYNRAICACYYFLPLRWKLGSQTFGILAYLTILSASIGYNSTHIDPNWKPFSVFITPFLIWDTTFQEIYNFIYVEVESQFLTVWNLLVAAIGFLHLVMIWIGKGDTSTSKRGNSLLVLILNKYIKPNEYFIVGILEPLIIASIALLLWTEFEDIYGALFLWIASLSETLQQLFDESNKRHLDGILKA